MRGARSLLCPVCGGFFATFRHEDRLGKLIKSMECGCGAEKIVTTDKNYFTIIVKNHGVVIGERKGVLEKKGRRFLWQRDNPHYIVSSKAANI